MYVKRLTEGNEKFNRNFVLLQICFKMVERLDILKIQFDYLMNI